MHSEPVYERISFGDIGLIQPLWEKLRIIHHHDSVYFREFYERFTFETRTGKFAGLGDDRLRVEIVKSGGIIIGYCVATVEGVAGEIDSIYIEESHRGAGIGEKLVNNALDWFRERSVSRITAAVANGHESVFPFYRKFNFYPRLTVLERKGG